MTFNNCMLSYVCLLGNFWHWHGHGSCKAGGVEMMSEAKHNLGDKAKLVAVTQLTSTSEEDNMRDCQNIQTTVQSLL